MRMVLTKDNLHINNMMISKKMILSLLTLESSEDEMITLIVKKVVLLPVDNEVDSKIGILMDII